MDINLLNNSELARRMGVSAVTCHRLMTGKVRTEKRLQQIADILRMDVANLKAQINEKMKRHGHAGKHAPAHSRTHGVPRFRDQRLCARNLQAV